MKKIFFFAASAALVLASCSSDDVIAPDNAIAINDNGLVPVELGLTRSSADVMQTRGTGTVGAIDEDDNNYDHEDLYVLMTTVNKAPWGLTQTADLGYQFDASFISHPVKPKPEEAKAAGVWNLDYIYYTDGEGKYYPTDGTYSDFFAFYVDDAVEGAGGKGGNIASQIDYSTTDGNALLLFEIDGTQDLLAGKANNGAATGYNDRTGFSAKTARAGLIPRIPMQHLLTRLTFAVRPGNPQAKGVSVKQILLEPKYNEGALLVAYDEEGTKDPSELIAWDGEGTVGVGSTYDTPTDLFKLHSPASSKADADDPYDNKPKLVLKDELVTFDDDNMTITDGVYDPVSVGDAFFVKPNETEYRIIIVYELPLNGEGGEATTTTASDNLYVRLSNGGNLEIGNSYNVIITLYGLNEIEIETTLEAWKDGGDIDLDTADPKNSLPGSNDDEEEGEGDDEEEDDDDADAGQGQD